MCYFWICTSDTTPWTGTDAWKYWIGLRWDPGNAASYVRISVGLLWWPARAGTNALCLRDTWL